MALHERGVDITYSYCSTTVTPHGHLTDNRCPAIAVRSGNSFEKYNLWRRAVTELRYGVNAARTVWHVKPTTHVVCNMPLVSLFIVWVLCLPRRVRLITWLQDVQSGLAEGLLGGGIVTRAVSMLESFLLRRSTRVIAISPAIATEARRRGAAAHRVGMLPNWAPIESIPQRPQSNPWSTARGLDEGLTFVYTGTLARKHNPALLLRLAEAVQHLDSRVLVVSEGEGAEWLDGLAAEIRPGNLLVMPYQPFDEYADVLGTADVLVVLLEPFAGEFTVPSKTLSYLCAGKPILASIPSDNEAAVTIRDNAQAGIVVACDDDDGFTDAALRLADDGDLRDRLGANGRSYAEHHFDHRRIVDLFLEELAESGHRLPGAGQLTVH